MARAWSLGLVALSLAAPAALARTVFPLPRDTRPVRVVSAPNGAVWMTDDLAA